VTYWNEILILADGKILLAYYSKMNQYIFTGEVGTRTVYRTCETGLGLHSLLSYNTVYNWKCSDILEELTTSISG